MLQYRGFLRCNATNRQVQLLCSRHCISGNTEHHFCLHWKYSPLVNQPLDRMIFLPQKSGVVCRCNRRYDSLNDIFCHRIPKPCHTSRTKDSHYIKLKYRLVRSWIVGYVYAQRKSSNNLTESSKKMGEIAIPTKERINYYYLQLDRRLPDFILTSKMRSI